MILEKFVIKEKVSLRGLALLVLLFSSTVYGVTGFTDNFNGPTLDPQWSVMGSAGTFVSGHYRITHGGSGVTGLNRTVGSGSFTEVIELDNMNFSGTVDTQYKHIDASGYQLIVQVINDSVNCGVWTGSAYMPKGSSPLGGATDVNLRVTWTDEPGVGGSWLIEYEANDGGYQTLVTVTAAEYPSDDSAGRTTEFWMGATGTGSIDVDYYSIVGDNAPSQPDPTDSAQDVSIATNLSWIAGSSATLQEIFFGTDPNAFGLAVKTGDGTLNQVTNAELSGPLALDTVYYWRVDTDGNTGVVWSFTTEDGNAVGPNPADGASAINIVTDLSWSPGPGATSQNIYFGTNPAAFGPPIKSGDGNLSSVSNAELGGPLAYSTELFWRVDTDGNTGTLWSFTTAPGLPSSLLEAQVGYHSQDVKMAFLRSATQIPDPNPTGQTFELVDNSNDQVVYSGAVAYWGEKWLTSWWVMDFSSVRTPGEYYLRQGAKQSSVFKISDMVFTEAELAMVALDQLTDRLVTWSDSKGHTTTIYHGCAARITSELQGVGNVIHALADIYDNKAIYDNLSPAYQQMLVNHLIIGADYLVDSQLYSIDPVQFSDPLIKGTHIHSWVSIIWYDVPEYAYEGQVFNGFQDMALAMTGLARAVEVLNDVGGYPSKVTSYLNSADVAYECAMFRPYYRPEKQAIMTEQTDPALDVGTYFLQIYDRDEPKGWMPSTELRVRDMLPFVWACTMLNEVTGQQKYLDSAITYANKIAPLQFVDWENPIDGTFGTFYAFPGDTTSMMLEHHQFHAWNLGATTPANMAGLIELIDLAPEDPNVAVWYNVVKTYGENYVKKSALLSPFKIYPYSTYTDPVHGGVKFFQVYAHGMMGGHYGAIGKYMMYLADFLNDSSYQELANNNVNFVVGLNSGFPTAYVETEWNAISLIKGVGVNFFDRPPIGNGTNPTLQQYAENGSGFNGFSAFPQFAPGFLSQAPDGPRGIITPSGGYFFNEDWIVHSHAYVSGVAMLEAPFELNIVTTNNALAVDAGVSVDLTDNAPPHTNTLLAYNTGVTGTLTVNDLPLQTQGTLTVSYNGQNISRHIETMGSGQLSWQIDFADHVQVSIDTPPLVPLGQNATAQITLTNQGSSATTANVVLSADGVSLGTIQYAEPLGVGETKVKTINITAGSKVKPYLLYARVTSGSNVETAIGDGKVGNLRANLNDTDNIINFKDFSLLSSEWMELGPGLLYDIDGGGVNGSDLKIMAEEWLLGN